MKYESRIIADNTKKLRIHVRAKRIEIDIQNKIIISVYVTHRPKFNCDSIHLRIEIRVNRITNKRKRYVSSSRCLFP